MKKVWMIVLLVCAMPVVSFGSELRMHEGAANGAQCDAARRYQEQGLDFVGFEEEEGSALSADS